MSAYSGSLSSKRKADLLEIAEALGLPDTASSTVADLVNSIQSYLKENEERLINNDQFKGLFGRRPRHQSSESDTAVDVKNAVDTTVKKSRKSINKVVERVANAIDPANISLPESPINVNRIAEVAEQAKDAATEQLAVALAPAQELIPDELAVQVKHARHHLIQYVQDSRLRVEDHVRLLQAHLSKPEQLVGTAIAIEALFVLFNVVQSYNRTYFFPPPGGDKGTFGSLLHGLFFWLPSFALTVRVPDWISFNPTSSVWPALTWWATTTVLPPFALSTLVSYVPQKGIPRTGHNTRYASFHPPRPTADPLTFALIRLAILLYPLTDAAPSSFVDALDISGNAQVRALGAGLLAALLLVGRLSS